VALGDRNGQLLINAVSGQVAHSTDMDGYPTNQALSQTFMGGSEKIIFRFRG
jgi:hypothetical protein